MKDALGKKLAVGDRIIKGKESGHRIYYKVGVIIEVGEDKHLYGNSQWLKARWDGEESTKRAGKCRPDYCLRLPIL